ERDARRSRARTAAFAGRSRTGAHRPGARERAVEQEAGGRRARDQPRHALSEDRRVRTRGRGAVVAEQSTASRLARATASFLHTDYGLDGWNWFVPKHSVGHSRAVRGARVLVSIP